MRNEVLACLATDVHHVKSYFSGRWFFGFRILAHVQSPKGQSYSNRNRAPTVMGCAVPCDQHHGAVDGGPCFRSLAQHILQPGHQ
jgi:hypothetical protein